MSAVRPLLSTTFAVLWCNLSNLRAISSSTGFSMASMPLGAGVAVSAHFF